MAKEVALFNDQVRLYGRHAQRVYYLTNIIEPEKKTKIFPTNISVYKNAGLVGFLYGRKAEPDDTRDENGKVISQNIMDKQIFDAAPDMRFNMRMILMLDKEYEPDPVKRMDKALRNLGKDPADISLYESYVRGGIDVLYEKLCGNASDPSSYVSNIYNFIEDFNEMFNEGLSRESVLDNIRKK